LIKQLTFQKFPKHSNSIHHLKTAYIAASVQSAQTEPRSPYNATT